MTATTTTKTVYQYIQEAIESFDSKTEEQKLAIKSYADELRIHNMKSGLPPSELWHNLRDRGLGIHIYAAIVLCDAETRWLLQAIYSENEELGASEDAIEDALETLCNTIFN